MNRLSDHTSVCHFAPTEPPACITPELRASATNCPGCRCLLRQLREDLLRAKGFEEPTAEQCKKNLALNIALREWPKD